MVVLEPLNKLLQQKWETFASKRFYFSFISYLSFMIIFTAIAYYQPLRVKVSPVFFHLARPEWMEMCFKRLGVVITTTAVCLQYYFFLFFSCSLHFQWSSQPEASCGSLD